MLKFNNGKFRIMQVTDAQDLHFVRRSMIKMLNNAYDRMKPDLIVFTGDNILGNHLCDARFGSRIVVHDKAGEEKNMRTAIDKLVAPVEKRGIPFAFIYGNHDDMNRMTKTEQTSFYRGYSCCVNPRDDEPSFCLPLYSADGTKRIFNIFMLDTAEKDSPHGLKAEDVAMVRRTAEESKEPGGTAVPAVAFMHIPPEEEMELIEEAPDGVRGPDGKFYRLKENAHGDFFEYPDTCPSNGLFDIAEECGIRAVVCGHDHPNGFGGKVGNVEIMQTPCASFRCYGKRNRGVRIIDINENGGFETYLLSMNDLLGDGVAAELRYLWDADENEDKKAVALVSSAVAAAVSVSASLIGSYARKKK